MADTETDTTGTGTKGGPAQAPEAKEAHHPSVGEYVEIGIILAVLTAIEVGLYYAPVARAVTIPALITLTIAKFALVVMWFMHLRFDSRIFRRLLVVGLLLAGSIFTVALVLVT